MKNSIAILIFALFGIGFGGFSQGIYPAGARSISMANASVTQNDVWSAYNNVGAAADVKTFQVGVSYHNRFLLKELQTQGVAIIVPLKTGALTVGARHFGYRQFRSLNAGVGYSMRLFKKFYAGAQINYQGLYLPQNYGSKNTVSGDIGIYAYIKENWKVGASVANLWRAKLSKYQDDRLTTAIRLGTSYHFSEKVLFVLEAEKRIDDPMRGKLGVEYQVVKNLFLRGGVATAPIEFSFGMGYQFKMIGISAGTSYRQILGWSPHFSFIFKGKDK